MTFRSTCCGVAVLSLLVVACGQTTSPPETSDRVPDTPFGWRPNPSPVYDVGLDRTQQRNGDAAAYIVSRTASASVSGGLTQFVRADDYRGRRLRLTGWVRISGVTGPGAGFWMRVDGPGGTIALDVMDGRRLVGDSDWQQASVVLDVPENAIGIAFGALLGGPGDVVVDDLSLETVALDVPVTATAREPTQGADSASVAAAYAGQPVGPVNLDFEGPPDATVAYLRDAAVGFSGTNPTASDADLEPLRQMIGDARVVGLGEGTHGTREFFLMKHRILEFLVRQMGFTVFAIEATSPEADLVNDYVLNGTGDPKKLLSNLYFWIWNTQEVLDMIQWMRQWNLTAPPDRRVQFRGIDMQYPGMAMDIVTTFIGNVDPASANFVADRFQCLADYRNQGPVWPTPDIAYADRPSSFRDACRAGLQEVFDLLQSHRNGYEAASSAALYEQALHSARLVQQFEQRAGDTESLPTLRDSFMAENTLWLLDRAAPGARMVLWAHNLHVNRRPGAMGDSLAHALGDAYVNVGFLFAHGAFNARDARGAQQLHSWQAGDLPDGAFENVFLQTKRPRLLFDTRHLADGGAPAEPLAGPILMRNVGLSFNPDDPDNYFTPHLFPDYYDILLYVEETTPSTLLPFVYQ